MQFKNLAEEMTEKDLKEVLEIIYPDTIFSGYKRMERKKEIPGHEKRIWSNKERGKSKLLCTEKQQRNGGSGIRFWSFFTETLCTG